MDTKTRAFLRSFMKDIQKKRTLHASVIWPSVLCGPGLREEIIQRLSDCFMSSNIVKEKIQESIVTQETVASETTFTSSLYVFTGDELYETLYDLALCINTTKPKFPELQTIDESLI